MATADMAVLVFDTKFKWDQIPQPLQSGLISNYPKKSI